MDSAVYLLVMYLLIVAINVGVLLLLWKSTGERSFRTASYAWACCFLNIVEGISTANSSPYVKVAALTVFFPSYFMLSKLLWELEGRKVNVKASILALVLGVLGAVAVYFAGGPVRLAMFSVAAAAGFPAIFAGAEAALSRWSSYSLAMKGLVIATFLSGLHMLDYPFAFDHPELLKAGFTLGISMGAALTLFAPGAILEKVSLEKGRLESELALKGTLSHAAKLSALGEMAGGVAHEINNPLTIVRVNLNLVRELIHGAGGDLKEVTKRCESAEGATERIAKIVASLRAFSRDGSHDPLLQEPVGKLIESVLALCQESFRERGIHLTVEKIDPLLTARCRAVEVTQALLNLLNNARDAAAGKPGSWVRLEVSKNGTQVEIAITDSGDGIPVELRDRIFEPFFTTKGVGKATGLGLSVSKGLAEAQGGELALDQTSPNTRFVLRLPEV